MSKDLFINLIKSFIKLNRFYCRQLEKNFPNFFGDPDNYNEDIKKLIDSYIKDNLPRSILEAGGVNRPILKKSNDYIYFGLDIDDQPSYHNIYDTFLFQSIEKPLDQKFDLIISKTLLEHVPDNTKSLKVIYDALQNNGMMMHYIPCKYHFYSMILRMIGPKLQKFLIHYLRPETESVTGYPVFFNKCSSHSMENLCNNIGFRKVEIKTYYRATDYFSFFVPVFMIIAIFENLFKFFDLKVFASGIILVAKK